MKIKGQEEEAVEDFSEEIMGLADEEQQLEYETATKEADPTYLAEELKPESHEEETPDGEHAEESVESTEEEEQSFEEEAEAPADSAESAEAGGQDDGDSSDEADAGDDRDEVIERLKELLNSGGALPVAEALEEEEATAPSVEDKVTPYETTEPLEAVGIDLSSLTEDEKDAVASGDLSPLQGILNKALKETSAYNVQQMAAVVQDVVEGNLAVQRQIENFWESPANEDVRDMREYVVRIAASNDDPSKSVGEVLKESADKLRSVLKVKAAKDKQKNRSNGPKAFAGKTRRPVNSEKAKPVVTQEEQDLIDLIEDLQ